MKRSFLKNEEMSDSEESQMNMTLSPVKKMKMQHDNYKSQEKIVVDAVLKHAAPCSEGACHGVYRKQMNDIDFIDISNITGIPQEECKSLLELVIRKVTKFKCLNQVLTEALNMLPERRLYAAAFVNFMDDKRHDIDEVRKRLLLSKVDAAKSIWEKLSNEEKKEYEGGSSSSSHSDRTPFEIYFNKLKVKTSGLTYNEARSNFSALKQSKRLALIKCSAELLMANERDSKTLNDTQAGSSQAELKIKGPSKEEVQFYLNCHGLPAPPKKSPSLFFYEKKHGVSSSKTILIDAIKAFKELPEKKQKKWDRKFKKAWEVYNTELDAWLKTQDEVTKYLYKKSSAKKTKMSGTKKIISNIKTVEAPVSKIKFASEPEIPPLTPKQLFIKSSDLAPKEASLAYSKLSKDDVKNLTDQTDMFREKYKKRILKYARSLPEIKKSLYIGFKRLKCIQIFNEDIFKDEFPDNNYPAFHSPLKTKSNDPVPNCVPDKAYIEQSSPEGTP